MGTPRKRKPEQPRASLQERKHQLVREAIRNAAFDLFLEQGYEEVRIEDIAARAGVSRRTFFRYFASKDDLMAQGVDEFREMIRAVLAEGPPRRALADLFRETAVLLARRSAAAPRARDVVRVMLESPAARQAQQSRVPAVQDLLEEAFRSRCGRRREDQAAAGIFAAMTLAAVGVAMRLWALQESADAGEVAGKVIAAFERLAWGRPQRRRVRSDS